METNSTAGGSVGTTQNMSKSEAMNSTMQNTTVAMNTPMKYGGYTGAGLDFLTQHMTPNRAVGVGEANGTGLRSRSNYLPGQGIVGKIGYMGAGGNYGRNFGQGSIARVKKNLYETSR